MRFERKMRFGIIADVLSWHVCLENTSACTLVYYVITYDDIIRQYIHLEYYISVYTGHTC